MQDDHWPEQKLRNVQLDGGQGGQAARVTVPPPPGPPHPQPDSVYLSDHVVVQDQEQQG